MYTEEWSQNKFVYQQMFDLPTIYICIHIQGHVSFSWMKKGHRWEKFMQLWFNTTKINSFIERQKSEV